MFQNELSRTLEINQAAAARGDAKRTKRATLWNVLILLQTLPLRDSTPEALRQLHTRRVSDTIAALLAEYEDASFITELQTTEKALRGDVADIITELKKLRGEGLI